MKPIIYNSWAIQIKFDYEYRFFVFFCHEGPAHKKRAINSWKLLEAKINSYASKLIIDNCSIIEVIFINLCLLDIMFFHSHFFFAILSCYCLKIFILLANSIGLFL